MWKLLAFAPFAAIPPSSGYESHSRRSRQSRREPASLFIPAPGQTDRFGNYTVGGDVAPPILMYSECPVYSETMMEIDAEGTVLITAILGIDGVPTGTALVIPFMRPFDLAALRATNELRFEPATLGGKAVPARIFVQYTFPRSKAAAIPKIVHPGHSLEPPLALSAVMPEYPRAARRKRQRGTVEISLVITREGLPANPQIVRHAARSLELSALRAVRLFRFKPATMAGEAVAAYITIDVTYRLFY
jgi:TonB family protein